MEDVTDGSILSVVVSRDRLFKPYKLLLLVCVGLFVFVSSTCFTIFITFKDVRRRLLVPCDSTASGFDVVVIAGVELLPNFVERYAIALLLLLLSLSLLVLYL